LFWVQLTPLRPSYLLLRSDNVRLEGLIRLASSIAEAIAFPSQPAPPTIPIFSAPANGTSLLSSFKLACIRVLSRNGPTPVVQATGLYKSGYIRVCVSCGCALL